MPYFVMNLQVEPAPRVRIPDVTVSLDITETSRLAAWRQLKVGEVSADGKYRLMQKYGSLRRLPVKPSEDGSCSANHEAYLGYGYKLEVITQHSGRNRRPWWFHRLESPNVAF